MTKEDILKTRKNGLGSSDAKMVAKIAKNGCLNDSDRQRIAIMLGLEERKQFSTEATRMGDAIEEKIFEIIKEKYPNAISNPYYKSEALSKKYGFDIFNHIDYEVELEDKLIWIENKATKKSAKNTFAEYTSQFVWHQILLDEKAELIGKTPILMFSHYLVEDYTDDFISENLTIEKVYLIDTFVDYGLKIISEAIKDFKYEPREELYADNLPEKIQNRLSEIKGFFNQISEAEKQIDLFKETMLNLMIESNVKSIKNEFFYLTVTPEGVTTTFDKKTFEKENPDLAAKYYKQSKRKAYLTIRNH